MMAVGLQKRQSAVVLLGEGRPHSAWVSKAAHDGFHSYARKVTCRTLLRACLPGHTYQHTSVAIYKRVPDNKARLFCGFTWKG